MSVGHHALIVEDDDLVAERLAQLLASLGHTSDRAGTLDEARAALAPGKRRYCYVVLDRRFPASAGAEPEETCGDTALEVLRASDPSRNPSTGKHWFQILVTTSFWREPEFISRMLEMEADGFIPKPLGEKGTPVLSAVRAALVRAGRTDHDACARGPGEARGGRRASSAPPAGGEEAVPIVAQLVVDAVRMKRQMGFLVNGQRRSLQDSKFLPLLRMVLARLERGAGWKSRAWLRFERAPEVPSRIGEAFKGLVPEGFVVVERDGEGNFRLNPGVEVAAVDWEALEGHPSEEVRKIAKEARGRKG